METSDPKYKHKPSEKHTLEEVLKSLQDLIRNDLAEGATRPESAATDARLSGDAAAPASAFRGGNPPQVREDFAPVSPASGPVNLDAVMRSLKDLVGNELNVGDESPPAGLPAASKHEEYLAEENIEEYLPREFVPLDEELTFEEGAAPVPPPPVPETPELPGEISPELLETPDDATATAFSMTSEDVAPGTQHELFLEEPTRAIEPEYPTEPSGEPVESAASEISPADESPAPPKEQFMDDAGTSLPMIDVEESFDDNGYLDAAAPSPDSQPPETEEIVALDVGIPAEPDETPATSQAEPEPAIEAEDKNEIAPEVAEPDPENTEDRAFIDFDTLAGGETPSISESPAAGPESGGDTGTATEPEPPVAAPSPPATEMQTPAAADSVAPSTPTEPPAKETSPFSIDDIPVLNEVVAPPAGSTLPTDPSAAPPLPGPDRARDIVVRAVAKLNVEMRKSGGAGLDTRTILRLQQLIRQELEKVGEK